VLGLSLLPARYAALVAHAAELETRLVYAKIGDRARGLIKNYAPASFPSETFVRFSETILRPSETAIMLEQLAAQFEEQVQERNLTARAKAVLESAYGMTEEQAHHHLRLASRKSRRPLKDVAQEFIAERS
jgi:hypothetical protein